MEVQTLGLTYSCDDRKGSCILHLPSRASETLMISEIARTIRNLCALVGPSTIELLSDNDDLQSAQDQILLSPLLKDLRGESMLDTVSSWRGAQTTLFFSSQVDSATATALRLPPAALRRISPPVLVVNLGQTELKMAEVNCDGSWSALYTRRRRTRPLKRHPESVHTDSIIDDVLDGAHAALNSRHGLAAPPESVVLSVGSLVREGTLSPIPNGITRDMRSAEIFYLAECLRTGLTDLLGPLPIEYVNDGLMVALAHRNAADPGTTLSVRIGTSPCGGVDDEEVFGEIGWVALDSQTCSRISEIMGEKPALLVRDVLSAGSFLRLTDGVREEVLALVVAALTAEVSKFHDIRRVMLCGTVISQVDRDLVLRTFADLSTGVLSEEGVVLAFSALNDQRSLTAAGVANLVAVGGV